MISNSTIQAAWIAKLKANTAVTALVPAVEIREELWKGTTFTYPNIRVKLGNLTPTVQNNCQLFKSEVSFLVFGEQKSSKQVDDIAGVIADQFWGKQFTQGGVRFSGIVLDALVPAMVPEIDTNSWMAEVRFTTTVSSG